MASTTLKRPATASSSTSNNESSQLIKPTAPRMTTILGSALEVMIHEILYIRSLYPRDAFTSTRHLGGVNCHACRHPAVVDYIYNSLRVAVPAVCSGVADELLLVFYDSEGGSGGDRVLERYAFAFDVQSTLEACEKLQEEGELEVLKLITRRVQDLERSLRNVLLKIISLDGTRLGKKGRRAYTGTTTFKLCLHTSKAVHGLSEAAMSDETKADGSKEGEHPLEKCAELKSAMMEGKWFCPDQESCGFTDRPPGINSPQDISKIPLNIEEKKHSAFTRPLKSVYVPSCGLRMQLLMEVQD